MKINKLIINLLEIILKQIQVNCERILIVSITK